MASQAERKAARDRAVDVLSDYFKMLLHKTHDQGNLGRPHDLEAEVARVVDDIIIAAGGK